MASKDEILTGLLTKQFNVGVPLQLAEYTRYLSPGSASNYAERYLRLLTFLYEDLTDAYQKLYCASLGLKSVLNVTTIDRTDGGSFNSLVPLFTTSADPSKVTQWVATIMPSQGIQSSPDVLDALVLWCRGVMRTLERRALNETEVTVAIPLSVALNETLPPPPPKSTINPHPRKGMSIQFRITKDMLPFGNSLDELRVVGVGLTVFHGRDDQVPLEYTDAMRLAGNDAGKKNNAAYTYETPKLARLFATILTPPQKDSNGQVYSRLPVLLANVRIQGNASGDIEPLMSSDPACRNVDPLAPDPWTVNFDPNPVLWYKDDGQVQLHDIIGGVILHLRIRGMLLTK